MPRTAEMRENPAMVAAVACAATGVGSTSITDLLAIGHEKRPRHIAAGGSGLTRGCLDSLRLIGGNYHQSGFSSTSALALVHGIHSVNRGGPDR